MGFDLETWKRKLVLSTLVKAIFFRHSICHLDYLNKSLQQFDTSNFKAVKLKP